MDLIFYSIDIILFILFTVWILYLLVYAIGYRLPKRRINHIATSNKRYLVVFPAYKEDVVIVESVNNFLQQTYPSYLYQVTVVADSLRQDTLMAIKAQNIQIVIPTFVKRSKALALSLAIESNKHSEFDAIVILDADNHVDSDFLNRINSTFSIENTAIQVRRVAKSQESEIAYLDGLSEELNNSIFRQGHNNLGLPAALSGSGMVFEMNWFKNAISQIDSVGEDKELELLLLKDKINIYYLEDVYVYDEKISANKDFSNQRRRWIASQLDVFIKISKEFGNILKSRNWFMLDKMIQWSIPPRILMLGWGPLWIILLFFINPLLTLKWLTIYVVFFIALLIALPNQYYTKRTCQVLFKLPGLLIAMLRSLVGLKSGKTTFIHTPHGKS